MSYCNKRMMAPQRNGFQGSDVWNLESNKRMMAPQRRLWSYRLIDYLGSPYRYQRKRRERVPKGANKI